MKILTSTNPNVYTFYRSVVQLTIVCYEGVELNI